MELIFNSKKRNIDIVYDADDDEQTGIIQDIYDEKPVMEIIEDEEINNEMEKMTIETKPINELLELTKKVKMLSLKKMGKHILFNTYHLQPFEKEELQKIMRTYEDKTINEINEEFNKIVNMDIFCNPNLDYSKLPVYSI
jgi:hypothetical protein